jgi:hypothetical protein
VRQSVLPHPAHSPDLAPSDCHLFGPVQDELRGCHFADDKKLKQIFSDVFRSRGREFYNSAYSFLLKAHKSMLKMMKPLWKNSLITAKDVRTNHAHFIVIAITFSEKNGGITFVPPLVFLHLALKC